jgi:Ras homolog enriched in brain
MVIVGNKCDLKPESRQVPTGDGQTLAQKYKCSFTEASARLNYNVTKAFELILAETEKSADPSKPKTGPRCPMM